MIEQSYLSKAIRSARKRAGLSQVELARLLGVRQSSVSQWERGSTKPSTMHLLALAARLRCSLVELAGGPAGGDGGPATVLASGTAMGSADGAAVPDAERGASR
jgi:transcriptional regulator with XRE-family HTH domain